MENVEDLFKAEASNLVDLHVRTGANVGFTIPNYQRHYNWPTDNVNRLYSDIINGLHRLTTTTDTSAYTFLGTLILVRDSSRESTFRGESLLVVDGQQRLTTLALIACAFYELLRSEHIQDRVSAVGGSIRAWIDDEIRSRHDALYACTVGSQTVSPGSTSPFPRLIRRRDDARGDNPAESEYKSPIARFLSSFAQYCAADSQKFDPSLDSSVPIERGLLSNWNLIRASIARLDDPKWYEDQECHSFPVEEISRRQCRRLMDRLHAHYPDQNEENRAISQLIKNPDLHCLVRALAITSYFCSHVVLTRVTAQDESAAFDIFDALNTTGEPLTPIETLKPRVVDFEDRNNPSGYHGSEAELHFSSVEDGLAQLSRASERDRETKDLIVGFALLMEGYKLSRKLTDQRSYLGTRFDRAAKHGTASAVGYVQDLADFANFRRYYWSPSGIELLARFHSAHKVDEAQILMSFLLDMRTSLVLPILARFWHPDIKQFGDAAFLTVLRAVVAFVVLRRAATGGTANIDADLRKIMSPPPTGQNGTGFGLCKGLSNSNAQTPSPDIARSALLHLLKSELKHCDKERWVESVVNRATYAHSRDLARFIILSAAHNSVPSTSCSGGWQREGIISSPENEFLTYRHWAVRDHYKTVEHVAPQEPAGNWVLDLYQDDIVHTVGNLVLLPEAQNNAISNAPWAKKKQFYLALTEVRSDDQDFRIQQAKALGADFSASTQELLKSGDRLPLLDPLRDVESWNRETIANRTRNIAGLCWDVVRPWLG